MYRCRLALVQGIRVEGPLVRLPSDVLPKPGEAITYFRLDIASGVPVTSGLGGGVFAH